MHVTGTLVNVGTVAAGTAAGSLLGDRLPARIRDTVVHTIGLVTLAIGIAESLSAFQGPLAALTRASVVVVLGSLVVGGILGELARIEDGLDALGERLRRRFGRRQSTFTEGFVVASLVFCVGPLTILGSIQDGLRGDPSLLITKSVLDGFTSLALSSALGPGVGFSVLTILVVQGGLSLSAGAAAGVFDPPRIAAMQAVGGVMILGIGLRLLDLRQVRVANLLPALVLAPAVVAAIQQLR